MPCYQKLCKRTLRSMEWEKIADAHDYNCMLLESSHSTDMIAQACRKFRT